MNPAVVRVEDIHVPNYMRRDVFENHKDLTTAAKTGSIVVRESRDVREVRYLLVTGIKKFLALKTLGHAAVDVLILP